MTGFWPCLSPMNNTPDACLSFTRPSAWMMDLGMEGAPLDSSRIKRGRLENAKPGITMRNPHGRRQSCPARDGEGRSRGSSCRDIFKVDPVHGSDPPAALVGRINIGNRQRSCQEVITVEAKTPQIEPG